VVLYHKHQGSLDNGGRGGGWDLKVFHYR
jgi:hypothetical protein